MIIADSIPVPVADVALVPARSRSRRAAASPLLAAMLLAATGFGVRAVGLTRSFELWVDEMLYADLGASVAHGRIPSLPDGPFFLHPPGFFYLEAATIRLFGLPTGDSMSLVYDLRWLAATLGALTVGVAYLLMRRVAGAWPALWGALVLVLDPFVLRINSRVFLETLAGLAVLAGQWVLVRHFHRRDAGRPVARLVGAGLCLGYGVFTKDVFAFYAVLPILLAVVWKRTLRLREAGLVLVGVVVPYGLYLAYLWPAGYLAGWTSAKAMGVLRLFGVDKTTGFSAAGGPSLTAKLIEQAQHYGTSYVLLLVCPLAGLLAAFSRRPDRRLIGLAAVVMGAYGGYLVLFGTIEEQYAYPIMLAAVAALAVCAAMLIGRGRALRRLTVPALSLFLVAGAFLGTMQELTPDDGFRQFRAWVRTHLPVGAHVGVTNDTAVRAFADDPRFGPWSTAALLEAHGADYVLTVSLPTEEGYALARPSMLVWLEKNATAVFRDEGPTNGQTVLWFVPPTELAAAAARGVGGPPPPALSAGTAGATTGTSAGSTTGASHGAP